MLALFSISSVTSVPVFRAGGVSALVVCATAEANSKMVNTLPSKRFLRTDTVANEVDEERGINFNAIPSVEAIKNVFSKKVSLDNLLKYADKNQSPEFIFLKLDQTGTKLFDNSDLKVWVGYFRPINPRQPEAAIVTSLTTRYADEVLSKMLEAALKVPSTKKIAATLQVKQLEGWKSMGLSADDASKMLKLNSGVDNVLSNPNLNAWVKYLDDLNVNLPKNEKISMIDTFRANFGDEALSKVLVAAKKDPLTEKVASNMQQSLLNKWVLAKKDPADVSKILGNSLEGKFLYSTYAEKYNWRWPDRL